MEYYIEFIGFLAAFCTTIAFIALKVWKTRSTKDISLMMFVIFSFGVLSWLVYGLLIFNLPIIVANMITLTLSIYILINKIIFK